MQYKVIVGKAWAATWEAVTGGMAAMIWGAVIMAISIAIVRKIKGHDEAKDWAFESFVGIGATALAGVLLFLWHLLIATPMTLLAEQAAKIEELTAKIDAKSGIFVDVRQFTTIQQKPTEQIYVVWATIINLGEPTTVRYHSIEMIPSNGPAISGHAIKASVDPLMMRGRDGAIIPLRHRDSLSGKLDNQLSKNAIMEGHLLVRFPTLDGSEEIIKKANAMAGRLKLTVQDVHGKLYSDDMGFASEFDKSPISLPPSMQPLEMPQLSGAEGRMMEQMRAMGIKLAALENMMLMHREEQPKLLSRFLSYVIFTATSSKEIIPFEPREDMPIFVDWKSVSWEVTETNVSLGLPEIRFGNASTIRNTLVTLDKRVGSSFSINMGDPERVQNLIMWNNSFVVKGGGQGGIAIGGSLYTLVVEVAETRSDGTVIVLGIKEGPKGK